MNSSETDGLGLSVLIYMSAILGGLALFAVPAYVATRPQVYANPPLARANPLLNGPVIGERDLAPAPLAILKHRIIVDPKIVAALNAKITRSNSPSSGAQRLRWRSGRPDKRSRKFGISRSGRRLSFRCCSAAEKSAFI